MPIPVPSKMERQLALLLERYRAGEVTAVAFVAYDRAGELTTSEEAKAEQGVQLVGALTLSAHRLSALLAAEMEERT